MKQKSNNLSSGFTIVELLIVIVVIAVLAVITLIAFNGIQARAQVSAATSALSQASRKLEIYKIDNNGYPTTGNLSTAGVDTTGSILYQYKSDATDSYCLTATSGKVSYYQTNSGNLCR